MTTQLHPSPLKVKFSLPLAGEQREDPSRTQAHVQSIFSRFLDQSWTKNPSLYPLAHQQIAFSMNATPTEPICLRRLTDPGSGGGIRGILNANKQIFVSRLGDGMRIWNIESGKCLHTLEGHTGSIKTTALSLNGKRFISGSEDKTVKIWDVESGKCLHTLKGHTGSIRALALTSNAERLVSGSEDKTVKIWDVESGECTHTLEGHTGSVNAVIFTPNEESLISQSSDKTMKIWDWASLTCKKTLEADKPIRFIALSPDGQRLASSSEGAIEIWDTGSGKGIKTLPYPSEPNIADYIQFTLDGKRLILQPRERPMVEAWDIESRKHLYTLEGGLTHHSLPIALSPDGDRLIVGFLDSIIRIFNTKSGKCTHTLEGHTYLISSLALTSDGRKLISRSWDDTFRVWDLYPLPEMTIPPATPLKKIAQITLPNIGEYLEKMIAGRNEEQINEFDLAAIPFTIERIQTLPKAIRNEIYSQATNTDRKKAADIKDDHTTRTPSIQDSVKKFFTHINELPKEMQDDFYEKLKTEAQNSARDNAREYKNNLFRAAYNAILLASSIQLLYSLYCKITTPSKKDKGSYKKLSPSITKLPEEIPNTSLEQPSVKTQNILPTAGLIAKITAVFAFFRTNTIPFIERSVKKIFSRMNKLPKEILTLQHTRNALRAASIAMIAIGALALLNKRK